MYVHTSSLRHHSDYLTFLHGLYLVVAFACIMRGQVQPSRADNSHNKILIYAI